MQIEITTLCGLSCLECPHRLMKRKLQIMPEEVFDKLLNEYIIPMRPSTSILHKDGDCLFHPHIREYMGKIDEAITTKFDIYTNGLKLTSHFVEFLSGLKNKTRILISYHSHNADGSENDYTKIDEEIIKCLDVRAPNVEFVMTTHITELATAESKEAWKAFWTGISRNYPLFTAVHVNNCINPWTGLIKQANTVHFDACPYADFGHLFIGVTGNVIPCCMDLEEEMVFGNIMQESSETILARVKIFYEYKTANIHKESLCQRCLKA